MMDLRSRDMHNPVNRFSRQRGTVTMRGKWGTDWRLRLWLRANMKNAGQFPIRGETKKAFRIDGKHAYYWYDFPVANGEYSTGLVRMEI